MPVPVPKPVVRAVPLPVPVPKPEPKPSPKAEHKVEPKPEPKPKPKPEPEPATKSPPKPAPTPHAKPTKSADPVGAAIAAAGASKAASGKSSDAHKTTAPAGGSRIGADFLKGAAASTTSGKAQTPAAATAGPQVKAALAGAISRQLKPYWRTPQGVDTEQLVTILSFDLNPDGTLAGPVRARQEGITDSNRPQAKLHQENAIRAVKLATPFPLPAEYYDAWKHVQFRFDRTLSQ